jgi:hypothetical protein
LNETQRLIFSSRRRARAGLLVWIFAGLVAGEAVAAPAPARESRAPAKRAASPSLSPMAEPARPSRSAGPHPVWLAGPDGPIMPPQGFSPMGTIFGAAGPIAGAGGAACVAPIPPACARQADTYRGEAPRLTCEELTKKHVEAVYAYRVCLDDEASRAVRGANETIRLLKCRKPNLKDCA